MDNVISRTYLETLSFSDLLKIADEYGIDVPEDLNRSFLIGEILEISEEMSKSSFDNDMVISDIVEQMNGDDISVRSYNSTEVQVMLRNPAWAFVYWNISIADAQSLAKADISQMMLRISSFS